jgi:MoxR-like ATPase
MSQPVDAAGRDRLSENDVEAIDHLRDAYSSLRKELGRVIVGQDEVIERLSICLFARGHALLMGVPGLAKTLLVSKLAETMSLKFSRIQFTPDLMPMDITGTDILQDGADGRREDKNGAGKGTATRVRNAYLPEGDCCARPHDSQLD